MAIPGTNAKALTTSVVGDEYATTRSKVERFTSLVDMPPTAGSGPALRTVNPEARTQWDNERASRKLLRHEAESATKVYAVVDSMMAGLMLSEGERLRMRSALATHFFEDVTSFSLEMCYGSIQ